MKSKIIGCALLLSVIVVMGSCADDGLVPTAITEELATRSVYSTSFTDQVVSSDQIVRGTDVYTKNVEVTGNALLILQGSNSVTIEAPFTINTGALLEIRN